MAKKKSNVAYIPTIEPPPIETALKQIELKTIPPYPDKSVQYANYCKEFIGNNEYKLTKQIAFCYTKKVVNPSADISGWISGNSEIYVTSIDIQYAYTASSFNHIIYAQQLGSTIYTDVSLLELPFASGNVHMTFNPPRKLERVKDGNVFADIKFRVIGVTAGDTAVVTINGFIESN